MEQKVQKLKTFDVGSRFPLPTSVDTLSVLWIVVMSAGLSAEEAAGDALSLLAEQVRDKNTWTNRTIDEKAMFALL